MIERLQRALQHIDDLPLQEQELVAQQIEAWSATYVDWRALIGSVTLPDDFDEVDEVLKARHEVMPSLPIADDE